MSNLVKISSFCETNSGGTPSRDKADLYYGGEIPWVKSGELRENFITDTEEKITALALQESAAKLNPANSILLAMYGATVGRMAILGIEAATNQAICAINPDPQKADLRYVFHALQRQVPEFLLRAKGGAQPNISQGMIRDTEILLPSLQEQKRIAAILDKADSLRRKRQQAIRLVDDFLRAAFLDMFGDPESNPKHWPTTRLDEISLQITDGEHQTPQRSNEGIYLLSARNVQDGRLDFGDVDYVPHEEYERIRKRCEPVKGDILISCSGSIGRVAQVDVDVPLTLVRSVALVRPDPTKVRSGFLEHLLRTPSLQRAMQKASKSSAQANLFQAPIRALTAILPPISLQDKFEQIRLQMLKTRKKISESCDEHQAFCAAIQNTYF